MPHCADFFDKWEKKYNFCHLGVLTARKIDRYIEIVHELIDVHGCIKNDVYSFFPSAALFNSGFLGLKRESPLRSEVISRTAQWIQDKKTIRQRDMRNWTGVVHWTPEFIEKNCHHLAIRSFKAGRAKKKISMSNVKNASSDNQPCTLGGNSATQTLEQKILHIYNISSKGQINVLQILVDKKKAKDLYDAYCLVLAWAAVRIESESDPRMEKSTGKSMPSTEVPNTEIFTIKKGDRVIQTGGSKRMFGIGEIRRVNDEAKQALVLFSNGLDWIPLQHLSPAPGKSG